MISKFNIKIKVYGFDLVRDYEALFDLVRRTLQSRI